MHDTRWKPFLMLTGHVSRSGDIRGRTVGELPWLLGLDPEQVRSGPCALYGLRYLHPGWVPFMTAVGRNDDRDTPESHNRPPLLAGQANVALADAGPLESELRALYDKAGGMIVKLLYPSQAQPTAADKAALRFPKGAGLREYVIHRPVCFQRLVDFDGADVQRRVQWT